MGGERRVVVVVVVMVKVKLLRTVSTGSNTGNCWGVFCFSVFPSLICSSVFARPHAGAVALVAFAHARQASVLLLDSLSS